MTLRVDAHQHFWSVARGDYVWLKPELTGLYRDFGAADLQPLLGRAQIDATVAVQAAETVAETRFLLDIAEATPWVAGVVGWADFAAPDAAATIADLAEHPKLLGLRPMIQDIPDDGWMLRADLAPAFAALAANDLAFDALVFPRHLPNLLTLLERHPELRVVVDHCAKPPIRTQAFQPWAGDIARVARETGASCKLSGIITEAASDWSAEDLRPYVEHVLDVFGPHRVIWGSDWPVATLASDYGRWVKTAEALTDALPPSDQAAIFGGNAIRFYGLDRQGRLAAAGMTGVARERPDA